MHKLDKVKVKIENIEPLIQAIKNKKAAVYVGAGVSISAGYDDWKTFLEKILKDYEKKYPNAEFKIAKKIIKSGDLILAAELINIETNKELSKSIKDIFQRKEPSSLHKELIKIPFTFAITSNFDDLLEKAYSNPGSYVKVFNWSEISDFFAHVKNGDFGILKIHGDSSIKSSHIIDKENYKNSIRNQSLNSQLLNFLALNTFLFIGSSLRDPDLLNVLEEGRLIYGKDFGPHYAILLDIELDESFKKYLDTFLGIRVIEIQTDKDRTEVTTQNIISFLRHLSGNVSSISYSNEEVSSMNADVFIFNKLVKQRLVELRKALAADKTSVIFIDSRELPGLEYLFVDGEKSLIGVKFATYKPKELRTMIKDFYSIGYGKQQTVYLPNTKNMDDIYRSSEQNEMEKVKNETLEEIFKEKYDDEKSVLITHLFSDGNCIGILLAESNVTDAFTEGHLNTFRDVSLLLSALFRKFELRLNSLTEVNFEYNTQRFQELLDTSFQLSEFELSYLFYKIDNRTGRLVPYFDKRKVPSKQKKEFFYEFGDLSLATHILHSNEEIYFDDVKDGVKKGRIAELGVDNFNIEGSIYGTPVRVGKYTSFILIAWSRKKMPFKKARISISKMAHLISNSNYDPNYEIVFENAEKFIDNINNKLKYENLTNWNFLKKMHSQKIEEKLTKEDALIKIDSLLKFFLQGLTELHCNLGRVRLWIRDGDKEQFKCYYSYSKENNVENEFKDETTPSKEIYCQYTERRFRVNPYAIHQHRTMLGQEDPNTEKLKKDVDGKWIVGPIVKRNNDGVPYHLLGYISADNHYIIDGKPKEKRCTEKQDYFQRYAVDLVAGMLEPLVLQILFLEKKKDN
ncbi:SIR2 family protein [Runella sp. MFBS21]|uniref:SIR2 family protein n=1 Tax=Runella sp. MFBS21 TaxID=3034018 RepID=UPI0023FA1977|nr:SIR2 family protein [Runella sp. MFBS21]MDF7816764.1 SIR2 family protein [Runella sp. MFBS21]